MGQGISGDVYLIIFCLTSLIMSGTEIILYTKSKSYEILNVKDTLELAVVFLFNLIIVAYGIYVFISDKKLLFLCISVIFTIQCIFWGVVFQRQHKKGQSRPE